MMYNLTGIGKSGVFLDPFCGSGTLIAEAFLHGQKNLVGTDLSEKAIADTKENLGWISAKHLELSADTKIEVCNVKELSEKLAPASVDAIATEPYLGVPLRGSESLADMEKQADELRSLYLSAFSEFKKVLKPGAGVVFIIPQFFSKSTSVKISDRLVPELKKLGFLPSPLLPQPLHTRDFILYRRPGQHVGREIWRFVFNG